LFAEAVKPTLESFHMEVVGIATTGAEGVDLARRLRPDLVLIDLGLPDESGLVTGRRILEEFPEAKLVALTALDSPAAVREAMKIGFHGYLTKDMPVSRFASSLRVAVEGQVVLPRRLTSTVGRPADQDGWALLASQLTARERETLNLLAEGLSGTEIAKALGISTNTVRTHIQSILTKLQVHSRLEAAAVALRRGLVRLPPRDEDADR